MRGKVSTDELYDTIEVEDTAHGLIRFENGLKANFYCTNTFGIDRPVEIELVFEKAILKTDAETLYLNKDGRHHDPVHVGGVRREGLLGNPA